jgi:hypothetical protein
VTEFLRTTTRGIIDCTSYQRAFGFGVQRAQMSMQSAIFISCRRPIVRIEGRRSRQKTLFASANGKDFAPSKSQGAGLAVST